jgi:hypothetical protein
MPAKADGGIPLDPLTILLDFVYRLLDQLSVIAQDQLGGLLGAIGQSLASTTDMIGTNLARLAGNIGEVISSIASGLLSSIQGAISPILSSLAELVESVKGVLGRIMEGIEETVGRMWARIVDTANDILSGLRNVMGAVVQTVLGFAESALATVVGWVNTATDAIRGLLTSALAYIRGLYDTAVRGVQGLLTDVSAAVKRILSESSALINEGWRKLVEGTDSIIAGLEKRMGDLRDAFKAASDDLIDGMGALTDEGLKPIKEAIEKATEGLFDWAKPADVEDFLKQIDFAASPHSLAALDRESAYAVFGRLTPSNPVGRYLWLIFFSVSIGLSLYSGIGNKCGEVILQEWQSVYLPSILAPTDSIAAWRRGTISETELEANLARHGFDREKAYQLREVTSNTLTGFEAVTAWRRGHVSETTRDLLLKSAGYSGVYAETLIKLTEVLPPVSDLITFAVREVFSEGQAQELGLFQEFPPQFAELAAKQGLSEENARRYWAAHWQLPSATQGYEMLHRGEIGETALDLLLKAQDYAPVWREKLRKIAYRTLTRVDVRRMHKVGVLTDDEVLKAYTDIGYDPTNAGRLRDFTIALNNPQTEETADELGKLTRANILGFYRDRLLTPERAAALLVESGLKPEAALLFVQAIDLDESRKDRTEEATLTIDLAVSGAISETEGEDRLRRIGLEETETQRYLLKLARALERKTKLPTRTEAEKMLGEGIIAEGDYRDLLERLGYAPVWVDAFARLARLDRGKA